MPVTSSAKKALRVSTRKQSQNVQVKSRMRSALKTFMETPSVEALQEAYSRIDRAVKHNLLHRNTAARRKSLLARKLSTK